LISPVPPWAPSSSTMAGSEPLGSLPSRWAKSWYAGAASTCAMARVRPFRCSSPPPSMRR
jgi:hypothetical protein